MQDTFVQDVLFLKVIESQQNVLFFFVLRGMMSELNSFGVRLTARYLWLRQYMMNQK